MKHETLLEARRRLTRELADAQSNIQQFRNVRAMDAHRMDEYELTVKGLTSQLTEAKSRLSILEERTNDYRTEVDKWQRDARQLRTTVVTLAKFIKE